MLAYKQANEEWRNTVQEMKITKEKKIEEKLRKIHKSIQNKRAMAEKHLRRNRSDKNLKSQNRIQKILEAERKIKINLKKNLISVENERIEMEKYVKEKSKIFIFNFSGKSSKSLQAKHGE
jgi:hypothetical protein